MGLGGGNAPQAAGDRAFCSIRARPANRQEVRTDVHFACYQQVVTKPSRAWQTCGHNASAATLLDLWQLLVRCPMLACGRWRPDIAAYVRVQVVVGHWPIAGSLPADFECLSHLRTIHP